MIHPIGYFKIWRNLFTKPIWLNSTSEQKVILITIIAMANFRENQWEWQGKKFQLKPGQFITSLESIAKECGDDVTIKKVRTALLRFEKLDFLANESAKTGRLVTILNWHVYQSEDDSEGKGEGRQRAKTGQTEGRQRATKEEGKEGKEGKNEKKNIYGEFQNIKLTQKEYDKLKTDFGNVEDLIKHLDEYIEMRGTKYKNHNLVIRKWVIDAVKNKNTGGQSNGAGFNRQIESNNEDAKLSNEELSRKYGGTWL